MTILAHTIDAAVGIDTHRDTHEAEIISTTGIVLATTQMPNFTRGFTQLLGWIVEHTPVPHVVLAIEGTRSYGIGVARAVTAAGLTVLECEQPTSTGRRGKGKTDAIDAHLAVLFVLRQDDQHLPTPRADGTREALRILLTARTEITTNSTAQINRPRALLLTGPDQDPDAARGALASTHPDRQGGGSQPAPTLMSASATTKFGDWPSPYAKRHGRSRQTAPTCRNCSTTSPPGSPTAPDSAPSPPLKPSSASPTPAGSVTRPHSPPSQAPARCLPAAANTLGAASAAGETGP